MIGPSHDGARSRLDTRPVPIRSQPGQGAVQHGSVAVGAASTTAGSYPTRNGWLNAVLRSVSASTK